MLAILLQKLEYLRVSNIRCFVINVTILCTMYIQCSLQESPINFPCDLSTCCRLHEAQYLRSQTLPFTVGDVNLKLSKLRPTERGTRTIQVHNARNYGIKTQGVSLFILNMAVFKTYEWEHTQFAHQRNTLAPNGRKECDSIIRHHHCITLGIWHVYETFIASHALSSVNF